MWNREILAPPSGGAWFCIMVEAFFKGGVEVGRLFGTFGVRGVFGKEIDCHMAYGLAKAFGTFLRRSVDRPKVVIGGDTRSSTKALKDAAISGLLSSGVDVIDVGTLPTPAVQFACRKIGVDGGISVTASHNPPEYNGLKLLEGNGMGLSREKEAKVEDIFFSENFFDADWRGAGRYREVDILEDYVEAIVSSVDVELIRERKPFVVADLGNGAGSLTLPYVLERIGCRVLSINAHPSGAFTARNPEPNEENLKDLVKVVKAIRPDFAVAQDGDADRAVFLDENGSFIQGDKTFALAMREVLRRKKGLVVTTVATSLVIDDVAREMGCDVMRTKVGDLVVTKALLEHGGVVGGEENGGVIFPDFTLGRDGAMATAKIVEALSRSGKSFSGLLAELPVYYQVKTKVHLEGDRKRVVEIVNDLARERGFKTDVTDGTKILVEDGWVLVRASGTEPIVRIFAETRKSMEEAKKLIDMAKDFLERAKKMI